MNSPKVFLPIDSVLPDLKQAVIAHSVVVLHAPPGAGKTTRVPLALLDVLPPEQGRIVMLEPRRIAAVSAARWMAQSLGEQPGETIGYAIRFDAKRSAQTRIEVVTEGILTRRIQADPGLEGTAMVIFDEFHERSIHADLALALCLDIRSALRSDLKILVMSATLDTDAIAALLGDAPVVRSTGKSYPVEERYLDESDKPLPVRITGAVRAALREAEGDILVFLPGAGEIRDCIKVLNESPAIQEYRVSLHGLYGDLPFEEQERAILPLRDRRKIVLATNIAETSLTIEGVRVVIDSGLTRMVRYDPGTGMNRLVTAPITHSAAEQRKGRAGRLGPGVCYRLYGRHVLAGMPPFPQPEILVSDMAPLALELAAWGAGSAEKLSWLDPPPRAAWDAGLNLLKDLGAVDASGAVTPAGRSMVRLPLHPRLSRLLLRAQELGCLRMGADLTALITERDIFRRPVSERNREEPDIVDRVEALRRWRREGGSGGFIDPAAVRAVERTSHQLLTLMAGQRTVGDEGDGPHDVIARLLLAAFPDRICKQREEGSNRFVHIQGRGVRISPNSHLVGSAYIVAVSADAGEYEEGIIHVAAAASEELIREERAARIRTVRNVAWDGKEGRIVAVREERLGSLVLSHRFFSPSDDETGPLIAEAIGVNPGILPFTHEARQLQARVALVCRSFPEEAWPDLSDQALFSEPREWLLPWLSGMRSTQDLKKVAVAALLKSRLTWNQARLLDERAPHSIVVPSGSRVAIDYGSGDQPVLAVKLQEMFGLADTPTIASGRIKLLLHLLSPARRPVQITQDLKGFWNSGYGEVKKDLKGRYPKHPWPDDPWNAVPTRRTKPREQ